jgi:hypothetical protein
LLSAAVVAFSTCLRGGSTFLVSAVVCPGCAAGGALTSCCSAGGGLLVSKETGGFGCRGKLDSMLVLAGI